MNKYIIYRLFNPNYEECYIGSTTNYKKRIYNHRSVCNNINRPEYNYKVYKFIREHGGFNKWQFEILEELECDIKEVRITEGIFIMMYDSTLNFVIPGRTRKEYIIDNKEKINDHYIANKDKRKKRVHQFYIANKEKKKQYYIANKDKLDEWRLTKINCICGSTITNCKKARHEKTNKHIKFINSIQ